MTQSEINESEWRDASNWRLGIYNSPRDTRVWVPKQIRWTGWTLNFAHSAAVWWLIALLTPSFVVLGAVLAVSLAK